MDWIDEQYTKIEQHKLNLEKYIDSIKLLYKPWPVKQQDGNLEDQSSEASSSAEKKSCASTPVLTAEEEQGIAMVDSLLKKAQKARDVQKKLAEPKRPKMKEKTVPEKTQNTPESIPANDSSAQSSNSNTPSSESALETKPKSVVKSVTNKPLSSKTTSSKSVSERGKSQGLRTASSGTNTSTSGKNIQSNVGSRPQSSSGQRKVVPAHASAPFQTNPRLATTKMQTTYRATTSRTASKLRQQTTASASGARRSKLISENAVSDRGQSGPGFHRNRQPESKDTNKIHTSETSEQTQSFRDREEKHVEKSTVSCGEPSDKQLVKDDSQDEIYNKDVQKLTGSFNSVKIDKQAEAAGEESKEGTEKKQFSLAIDGGSVKVPGKLKKLVHQNRKLREKLYTQTVTQKVDSPDLDPSEFPLHLEHSFGDETAKQSQLQARQAQYLLNVYTNLQELLDSLQLNNISGESDTADLYRSRCLMEHILTVYQQTEQLLHSADFRLLQQCKTAPTNDHVPSPLPRPQLSMVWYDNCAATAPVRPKLVKYSSYGDMERYMDAVFRIQWLQLQLDTQSHIADTLLPLLYSLDPSSSEFVQALRTGYSLLSQSESRPPVVIRDTIGEEEPEQEEEW